MSFWTDIPTLERLARVAPFVFIVLGFLVALGGQFVKSALETRITALKGAATLELKRTPPEVNAYLARSKETGDILVVMDARNLIPFRARWAIVTEKDRIIAGIMIEDHEIHPTTERWRFAAKAGIHQEQVINEYIELRFRYESLYAAELGNPPELRRELVRRCRLKDGSVYDWS